MTHDEEILRAREAERLLNDPLMSQAFSDVEAAVIGRLRSVDVGARDAHRDLIVTLQLLSSLKNILSTHIQTGKMAEIAKQESRAARALRRVANAV